MSCAVIFFSVTLKSSARMEATKYYLLDFAHKEAGVSSFFILRPKYGRCLFGQRAPFWALWDCSLSKFRGGKGGVTISLSENIGRFNSIDILNVSNEKLCRSYSQLNVLIDLKNCSPTSKESWMKRDVTYLDLTSKQEWRHSENRGEVSEFQIERITAIPLKVIRHDPNKNIVQSVNLGPQSLVDHFCQFVIGRFGLAINTRLTASAINKFL